MTAPLFVILGLGNSPDAFYKVHYIEWVGSSPFPTPLTRKEKKMKKHFDFLSLFGDDKKQPHQETDAEKIARIEQALADKDNEIATLKASNEELTKKVNSLKIDGLVKKVDTTPKVEDEEIQFDFDL